MTNKEPDDAKFPVKALNVVEVENPIIVENDKSSLSLVCSDEDDEVSCYDNDITTHSPQPIVNVVNCSDVVIGSVTQYHGPVTIVQHAHSPRLTGAIKEKETDKNNEAKDAIDDVELSRARTRKKILMCTISIFVISIIVVIVTLSVKFTSGTNATNKNDNLTYGEYNIIGHKYITRTMWGGRNPLNVVPMTHPADYVIVSHTAGKQCQTVEKCSETMRGIQDYHVAEIGSPDVGYNFVIGGDGNIYVGRGWDTKNFHEDKSMGINFSGNYIFDVLSDSQKDAFTKLLELGVKIKALSINYKIVAHNQTYSTLSPGKNVYAFIKTLPHFDPKRTI